ncbi:MAG: dipeptidase [Ignavibacteriales bacterium]
MKNHLIPFLAYSCSFLIGCSATNNVSSLEEEADELHKQIVSIDTHTDTPLNLVQKDFDVRMLHNAKDVHSKLDFPRMKQGGLDAVFFAAFVGQGPRTPEGNEAARQRVLMIIDTVHSALAKNSDLASLALSSDDAAKIKADGKLAIYLGVENGYAIGNDLSMINRYYDMGVRYITLCHTKNNDICGSSTDTSTAEYRGLSELGKKAVDVMNSLGMLIDVSHISDKAFYDVIERSQVPVIASHSCARALCNHPRNLDDDMLKKLAQNGGVIQLCILSDYIKTDPANHMRDSVFSEYYKKYDDYDALTDEQKIAAKNERAELNKKYPKVLATVSDAVDHIDHIVAVAGIDHVGIGTDFDGGGELDGCYDVSQMKNITVELLRRGYSHTDIGKIWGGNFLRVFRQVEQFAHKTAGK